MDPFIDLFHASWDIVKAGKLRCGVYMNSRTLPFSEERKKDLLLLEQGAADSGKAAPKALIPKAVDADDEDEPESDSDSDDDDDDVRVADIYSYFAPISLRDSKETPHSLFSSISPVIYVLVLAG